MNDVAEELHVVTGAFGYTGKYITERLLAAGKRVRTLTGHPDRPNPFGGSVEVARLDFNDPRELERQLCGASVLYNTYWVRFPYGGVDFDSAIENSRTLIAAAERAAVRRIVHISITNPSLASPLPYFHGKAVVEKFVRESTLSYAILRPTVIFGQEDILINNIAWLLRRFPFFAVAGAGDYKLQPVFVRDVAELAVSLGMAAENVTLDAAGPEAFSYTDLVEMIRQRVASRARIVHLSPGSVLFLGRMLSVVARDVVLTRDELDGLMADLLISQEPPRGRTRFTAWLEENAARLGVRYASELRRHYRPALEGA